MKRSDSWPPDVTLKPCGRPGAVGPGSRTAPLRGLPTSHLTRAGPQNIHTSSELQISPVYRTRQTLGPREARWLRPGSGGSQVEPSRPSLEFCRRSQVPTPGQTSHLVISPSGPSLSCPFPPVLHSYPSPSEYTWVSLREAGPGPGCSWGGWQGQRARSISTSAPPGPPVPPPLLPPAHQGSPRPEGLSHPGSGFLWWKQPAGGPEPG